MARISNDAILKRIFEEHRPYNTYLAFREGYRTYQINGAAVGNPYDADGVEAQAWDRGANAAMLYQRALAHLDAVPADAVAGPGWLVRLLQTGRC
jgi:hypothetical protein